MTILGKTLILAFLAGLLPIATPGAVPSIGRGQAQQAMAPGKPAAELVTAKAARRPDGTTENLDDAVSGWVIAISQEKGFEAWSGAQPEITPLGPGTHSQLVILRNEGKEVGYIVAASKPDGGWMLSEYGVGDSPLFSIDTLHRSLIRLGFIDSSQAGAKLPPNHEIRLTRAYYSPLEAFWILEQNGRTEYLDAKTAEQLPDPSAGGPLAPPVEPAPGAVPSGAKYRIGDSLLAEPFDPFLKAVWIKGKPLEIGTDEVTVLTEGLAQGKRLTYAARLYGKRVLAPYAVTGYQVWTGGPAYVFLDQEGTRAIPYPALLQNGRFFPVGE